MAVLVVVVGSIYGGDGGFFLTFARIFGECSTIHSLLAFFFFFFFKVEISSHTLIPLIRPGSVNSGSAN